MNTLTLNRIICAVTALLLGFGSASASNAVTHCAAYYEAEGSTAYASMLEGYRAIISGEHAWEKNIRARLDAHLKAHPNTINCRYTTNTLGTIAHLTIDIGSARTSGEGTAISLQWSIDNGVDLTLTNRDGQTALDRLDAVPAFAPAEARRAALRKILVDNAPSEPEPEPEPTPALTPLHHAVFAVKDSDAQAVKDRELQRLLADENTECVSANYPAASKGINNPIDVYRNSRDSNAPQLVPVPHPQLITKCEGLALHFGPVITQPVTEVHESIIAPNLAGEQAVFGYADKRYVLKLGTNVILRKGWTITIEFECKAVGGEECDSPFYTLPSRYGAYAETIRRGLGLHLRCGGPNLLTGSDDLEADAIASGEVQTHIFAPSTDYAIVRRCTASSTQPFDVRIKVTKPATS